MRKKQITGWVLFALGAIVIAFAVDAIHRISETKGFIDDVSNFFQHNPSWWNPLVTFFGGKAQEEVQDYSKIAIAFLILGILAAIAGAVMAIVYRKPNLREK